LTYFAVYSVTDPVMESFSSRVTFMTGLRQPKKRMFSGVEVLEFLSATNANSGPNSNVITAFFSVPSYSKFMMIMGISFVLKDLQINKKMS
jgi:hypothetical protein